MTQQNDAGSGGGLNGHGAGECGLECGMGMGREDADWWAELGMGRRNAARRAARACGVGNMEKDCER